MGMLISLQIWLKRFGIKSVACNKSTWVTQWHNERILYFTILMHGILSWNVIM